MKQVGPSLADICVTMDQQYIKELLEAMLSKENNIKKATNTPDQAAVYTAENAK